MLIGKQGIEKIYNDYLTGQFGVKAVMVDAFGRIKDVLWEKEPKRGKDIYLTVDVKLQKLIYDAFKYIKEEVNYIIKEAS